MAHVAVGPEKIFYFVLSETRFGECSKTRAMHPTYEANSGDMASLGIGHQPHMVSNI
jgi:hypothetical protein